MKTVYIDVYFLINFCVDILALALAAYITKIECGIKRLIGSAALGAMYAVLGILLSDRKYLMPIISPVLFILMILIVTGKSSFSRKIKYSLAFFISEIIFGGLVYYGYCLLNSLFKSEEYGTAATENRRLFVWGMILILSYGVVKILMYFLGKTANERVVRLCVGYAGKEESFEALVDSGNLATDPTGKRPVVFITHALAEKILNEKIDSDEGIDSLSASFKKRMRLIPVERSGKTEILYGFVSDYVTAVSNKKYENISVCFAIDKKGDYYGGYSALLPAAAINNVF